MGDIEGNYNHVPFQTKPPLCPPTSGSVWGATFNHSAANLRANLGLNSDQNMNPKRIRRSYIDTFTQDYSAHRSRRKEDQYFTYLSKKVKDIEAQVTDLRSQVESKQNQKHSLMLERERLMDQVAIHHKKALHKDAESEELKIQVKKLRELYVNQKAEELAQLINGNYTNVQPMSNEQGPLQSQMWTPAVSDEHETEPSSMELWVMELMDQNPNIDDLFL
ncbi:hypothetical protein MTR_3g465350 [Medicago truncatula]|uniref:Uncharacterized protein n=1 Tax=Medicago truncatula TaxID=3880 RepID=A0A072UY95_MEDTR|nr:hypothetical protein MTR_3g465350 [Medicago truncatula]